jgi:hypothetical protein
LASINIFPHLEEHDGGIELGDFYTNGVLTDETAIGRQSISNAHKNKNKN